MKQLFTLFIIIATSINLLAQDSLFTAWRTEVTPDKAPNEIRILSWNIRMLPRLIGRERIGTLKRARLLPNEITQDQPDIIVFQEAFDVRARRILKRKLHELYPYKVGPANLKFWRLQTNSGILMYSKYPLTFLEEIKYEQCSGSDCYARKGALLVETTINGQTFQVMGTHLNAGGTVEVKKSQVVQIVDLVNRHQTEGVPQLLCGDYNIHNDEKGSNELYLFLIDTLQVTDGPLLSEWKYTSGGMHTDLNEKEGLSLIDFILYRGNGIQPTQSERYARIYQKPWADNHKSLSDHHAVLLKISFK